MPEYAYACERGRFVIRRSMTDDTPPQCDGCDCGGKRALRLFEATVGIVYPTGRQSDRSHSDREMYERQRDKLIAKYGKKEALAQFDTFRVDPDDTPDAPFKPTKISPKDLERTVRSTEAGRKLLAAEERGALHVDAGGNLQIDD